MKSQTTTANRRELEARLKRLDKQYQEAIQQRARLIQSYDENLFDSELASLQDTIRALDRSAEDIDNERITIRKALE